VAAMCGITREELLDIASTETFKWFMKKRMKEIVALNITNVIYSIIESSNNPRNSGDRAILVSMIDALAGDEDSEHVGDDLYYTVEDDER
jgi:hypothetical protein